MLQDTGTLPQAGMTRADSPPLPSTILASIKLQQPYVNDMKKKQKTILIVEDNPLYREAVADTIADLYRVMTAETLKMGRQMLKSERPDLTLLDLRLPDGDGLDLVKTIRSSADTSAIVILTAVEDISTVVEAMRYGASDYLVKPVRVDELKIVVKKTLENIDIRRELDQRRQVDEAADRIHENIGGSAEMRKLEQQINVVGPSDSTVLIEGETGTGKELAARLIHRQSLRVNKPFVALNCAAIPKELIEAELFGYRSGAFTGARTKGIGKFELADNGTLLLDEIAELSLDAQAKLLRFLEIQEFYPVGSNRLCRVDVRIIASTNKNLKSMIGKQLFREDLYFRLNVCAITIPPLRERAADIMPLAEYFIRQFNLKFGKHVVGLHPQARDILLGQSWPGNVRELRNVLERVMLFCDDAEIGPEKLAFITMDAQSQSPDEPAIESGRNCGLDERLADLEKKLISDALKQTRGNKTKAAKLLKLSTPTFHYRLEKYGIHP